MNALVSAVGENRLMPLPDCQCITINGKTGYVRANSSWVIGRLVRDYEFWMHGDVKSTLDNIIDKSWEEQRIKAHEQCEPEPQRPTQVGLCVSIYKATQEQSSLGLTSPGILYTSLVVAVLQLGIAAIPCGIFGDWSILMITACGIALSALTASLPQWKKEKWACRCLPPSSTKKVILSRGNGSQHAIVIIGAEGFPDLEDLSSGQSNVNVLTSNATRAILGLFALFWILLLITAAGIQQNSWFLVAVGGVGILQNITFAGVPRHPKSHGIHIEFVEVISEEKVMQTLYKVEELYPGLGWSMLSTFFPSKLRPDEERKWAEYGERCG
jgi:hypothetical protein